MIAYRFEVLWSNGDSGIVGGIMAHSATEAWQMVVNHPAVLTVHIGLTTGIQLVVVGITLLPNC